MRAGRVLEVSAGRHEELFSAARCLCVRTSALVFCTRAQLAFTAGDGGAECKSQSNGLTQEKCFSKCGLPGEEDWA